MAARTTPAGLQLTGTPIPVGFGNGVAGGCIGYVARTTTAGPVSSGTASDITGMSVAVPVNSSRLILLRFWCAGAATSDTTTFGVVAIQEGATVLNWGRTGASAVAGLASGPAFSVDYLWRGPVAGTRTIKATLARSSGAGTVSLLAASPDAEMYLAAFDMGPSF